MKFSIILYIVCNIIYAQELVILKDDVFSIIYDRRIVKRVCFNQLNQDKILLSNDFLSTEEVFTILFDRFFPNFFIYNFNLGQLKKGHENSLFLIKCYTKEENILFEFKVECNLNNIIVYDLYSAEKVKLDLQKYKNQRHDGYIICDQENSFVTIKNSLDYIEIFKSFNQLFSEMLEVKNMCIDQKEDFWFEKIFTYKVFDPSFLIKTRKIKNGIYNVFYLCVKNYKSLSLPWLNKKEHFNCFELARKQLAELYESLLNLLKSAKSFTKNSKKIEENLKKYLFSLFDTMIKTTKMKIDAFKADDVSEIFNKLQNDIKLCDAFVKNVVESGNTNIRISNDSEIKNVDRFVDSFSSILIEYCDVLEIFDLIDLQDHILDDLDDVYDDYFNSSELHNIIFIAKEMKKYLLNYQYDKTDFLIFSETYYFKYDLAFELENILKYMFMVSDFKKTQKIKNSDYEVNFSEIDSVLDEKISNLKFKWNDTFSCFGRLEPLSFSYVLNHLSQEAEKTVKEMKEGDGERVEISKEKGNNLESNFLDNTLCFQSSNVNIEDLSSTKIQNDSGYFIQEETTMPEVDHSQFADESDDLLSNEERPFVEYKAVDEEQESFNLKNSVAVKNDDENPSCGNKNAEFSNSNVQQDEIKKPNKDYTNLNENSMFEKENYNVDNDKNAVADDKNVLFEHISNEIGEEPSVNTRYKNQGNQNKEINTKEQRKSTRFTFYIVTLFSISSMICLIVYFTFNNQNK